MTWATVLQEVRQMRFEELYEGIRGQFLSLHPFPLDWLARLQGQELAPISASIPSVDHS